MKLRCEQDGLLRRRWKISKENCARVAKLCLVRAIDRFTIRAVKWCSIPLTYCLSRIIESGQGSGMRVEGEMRLSNNMHSGMMLESFTQQGYDIDIATSRGTRTRVAMGTDL